MEVSGSVDIHHDLGPPGWGFLWDIAHSGPVAPEPLIVVSAPILPLFAGVRKGARLWAPPRLSYRQDRRPLHQPVDENCQDSDRGDEAQDEDP